MELPIPPEVQNQQLPPSAPGPHWKPAFFGLVILLALAGGYAWAANEMSWWPYGETGVVYESPTPEASPVVSCMPRPACLDATPACKPPEPIEGWCQTSPTSDRKTYTNTQYGFEFKYPADLTTQESETPPQVVTIKLVGGTLVEGVVVLNNQGRGGYNFQDGTESNGSVNAGGVTISYRSGIVIEYPSGLPGQRRIWYGSVNQDNIFFLFESPNGSDHTTLVEQIISTFKFE